MLSIVLVLLGLAAGLFLYNWNYFVNGEHAGRGIKNSDTRFINWKIDGNTRISLDDPQIIFLDVGSYVETVKLKGRFDGQSNVQVFFTTQPMEDFSEKNSFYVEHSLENGVLQFSLDRKIEMLRIDLTNEPGYVMQLESAVVYVSSFRFDLLTALTGMSVACVLWLPVYFPPSRWKAIRIYLLNFKKYSYLLSNLVKKDFTTKYRRSILGIVWSILNPLLMMMVITAVFQSLFRVQVENFPLYYLTGSLIFSLNAEATTGAMASIVSAGPLIRKVYIPKYIFPFEKCLFALLNCMFSFVAVLAMLFVLGAKFHWTLLLFWVPLFYVLVFCMGFGMILASFNVFFRDISHLYGVWVTAWMYLTPVIYPLDILPNQVIIFVKLNPLYYYVDYFRQLVLYGTIPGWQENAICILFSLGFLAIGLLVLKKNQDKFILYI